MQLETQEIAPGLIKAVLVGRLDIAGSAAIDVKLNALAASHKGMIVDMSAVDFLASLGIRTLLTCAKVMQRRGGGLALLSPQAAVLEVLEVSGVLDLMPAFATEAEARQSLGL
jgi:anti-anti-sigma factor